VARGRTHHITDERIRAMQTWRPRRIQLAAEWPASIEGNSWPGTTLRLVMPFRETLEQAFRLMCGPHSARFHKDEVHPWVLELKGRDSGAERLAQARAWLDTAGQFVAIRDWLDLSFALDYDRDHGRLDAARTRIGALRFRAKPLDDRPTPDVLEAANALTAACLEFLERMTCYHGADAIAAAPPARSDQPYDLPGYLARGIAQARGLKNLSPSIRTVRDRPDTKRRPLDAKLKNITGSVALDAAEFKGHSLILVDDIYQSGTSLNYLAKLLYDAGATAIYGLVCEKTSRDDDNILRPYGD
jgi:hypothetical protein